MEIKNPEELTDKVFDTANHEYNYKFVVDYPEKLESEINNMSSNAIKFIAIEVAFLALIITIFFSSLPNHIDKISEWLQLILLILFNLFFLCTISSIYYLIKCILVKKYDYYMFILTNELSKETLSFIYENQDISEDAKKFSENYTEFTKSLDIIGKNKKALMKKESYFKTATYLFITSMIILFIICIISLNLALLIK